MSAVARVAVELSTGAAQAAAKKLQAGVKKLEAAVDGLNRSAKSVQSSFKRMADSGKRGFDALAARAKKAAGSIGGLGKAAALAAAAAGAAAFARFAFGKAGQLEKQTKSLQVLTGSLDKAKAVISELQAFGAVTPFTSDELIETAKRLKAFGFETEQITDVTKRLADVAGATGADLGGIATAFGQIQAKGRLQTEELLQLQERGVGLGEELQKMYGMTGTEFSKALEKGQISAKAANVALNRLTEAGGKYANGAIAQSDTLFGKLSTLQDALDQFGRNIGKILEPIFKGIISFLTTITNQINNLFAEAEIARKVDKELGLSGTGAKRQFRGGGSIADRRALLDKRSAMIEEERKKRAAAQGPKTVDLKTPELRKGTAGGGKTQAEIIEDQRKASLDRIQALKDQASLAAALNDEEKRSVQLNIDLRKILESTVGLEKEEVKAEIDARLALEDKVLASIEYEESQKRAKDLAKQAADEAAKQAEKLKQQYAEIANTIRDGLVDGIMAAVDGSRSLTESLSGVLKQLAGIFLQRGIGNFASQGGGGLLGLIPGLANGGPASRGRPYVVGERGPELFVPNSSGTVVPNGAMGGANVVVNVDASGTEVQGNQGNADQLGRLIGQAVQAELIKQKRPGGLLTR
jgi:tape measure domain-containing protein